MYAKNRCFLQYMVALPELPHNLKMLEGHLFFTNKKATKMKHNLLLINFRIIKYEHWGIAIAFEIYRWSNAKIEKQV